MLKGNLLREWKNQGIPDSADVTNFHSVFCKTFSSGFIFWEIIFVLYALLIVAKQYIRKKHLLYTGLSGETKTGKRKLWFFFFILSMFLNANKSSFESKLQWPKQSESLGV